MFAPTSPEFPSLRPQSLLSERRAATRAPMALACRIALQNTPQQFIDVVLTNISATGARFASAKMPAIGASLVVRHPVGGQIAAKVVRHCADGFAAQFDLSETSVNFMLRLSAEHMAPSLESAVA